MVKRAPYNVDNWVRVENNLWKESWWMLQL